MNFNNMNEENNPLLNIQDVFEFIEKSRAHIPNPYELAFGIKQAEHVLNEVFKDNGFTVKIYNNMPLDMTIIK